MTDPATTTVAVPQALDRPGGADVRRAARLTAGAAAAAAALLLLFPVLRPWPDESVPSLELAAAFASGRWVVAHLCGIAGLAILAPTFLGLRALLRSRGARGVRAATAAAATAWSGAGMCALYFGAEIFGIRVLAKAALRTGDLAKLSDVDVLRNQPAALTLFGVGLALLAAAGVLAAAALWQSGVRPRWSGVPLAAGLVLYLPQFFGTAALRVAHGALVAGGLLLLAWAATRLPRTRTAGLPD